MFMGAPLPRLFRFPSSLLDPHFPCENMPKQRVGIIGSGEVSKALAHGFVELGYQVKVGSRSPDKLHLWPHELGGNLEAGTFEEAASFGDILVLAVLGDAVEQAIVKSDIDNFPGKLVIDVSNPLDFTKGMPPGLLERFTNSSIGELVQKMLPESQVVKCFNTVPNAMFYHPKFREARMLIAGNDKKAKDQVDQIMKEFGWAGTIDLGGIESARYMEALVPLWVRAATAVQSFESMFVLMN
jgi:8-hydroxy-5-deazaflavin:NADPH oxidoreductase